MSKPFVLIQLDKDRELRFSNRASIYFEELTGVTLFEAFSKLVSENGLSSLTLNHIFLNLNFPI